MQKNVASQRWYVFAFDETNNTPKAGDAANITANLYLDGVVNAVDDANPTELEDGYYVFDITQAESNADYILIAPESSTGDIQVIGVPGAAWTTAPNTNLLAIDGSGRMDVGEWLGQAVTLSTGSKPDVNVNEISDDGTAADDLELLVENMKGTDHKALLSVDAQDLSATLDVNTKALGGTVQSATDLKDFADAGYDPVANKVNGVKLVDTTTTNTDMVTAAPTAVQNRQEMDSNSTELAKIGTIPALDGAGQTIGAAIGKLADDNAGANYDATNDSLERIANTAPLGTVMRGTDGANTTVPDAAGIVAALHVTTDALIAALNDPTAAAIATAVMAKTVDGALDVTEALTVILAMAAGDMAKSSNTYTYDQQDGTVKLTEVVAANSVTRTIA